MNTVTEIKPKSYSLRQFGDRPNGGEYVCKLYPSGDFTIGKSQPVKQDTHNHPLEGILKDGFGTAYTSRQPEIQPDGGRLYDLAEKLASAGLETQAYQVGQAAGNAIANEDDGQGEAMGLSVATNYHKRNRKGLKGITPQGKRMVRSCAAILEDKYGRDCTTFGTNTLPPLPAEEMELVCCGWSELMRQYFQEVRRLLERRGLSTDFLYVVEIQEKRYECWGQVVPHVHWLVQGRKNRRSHWLILPAEIQAIWQRLLSNLLGHEVDCSAATRIEKPRNSLRAELGKYLSKGGTVLKKIIDAGQADLLPTTWWSASLDLKREVKQAITILTGDECLEFIDSLESLQNAGLLRFRKIMHKFDDGFEICLGFVGFLLSRALQQSLSTA
jgi:hypothetical protein